jgi:hypothetical protein
MNSPNKIFFGYSRPKKKLPLPLFSWAIRLFYGWIPFSHVMVFWYSETAKSPVYYEASGHELKFLGFRAFHQRSELVEVWSREVTPLQQAQLTDYCMRKAGTKYGTLQIIGIILARLLRLKYNPIDRGSSAQVCSEIAGRIIEDIFNESTHLDLDLAGPPELREFMFHSPNFKLEWSRIIK